MRRKPQVGDVVAVYWRDARGGVICGWRPWDSLGGKVAEAEAFGVLKDDGDPVVIVPHRVTIEDDVAGDGELNIPRDWITKTIVLLRKTK